MSTRQKWLLLLLVLGLALPSYGRLVHPSDFDLYLNGTTLTVVGHISFGGEGLYVGTYEEATPSQGALSGTATIEGIPANAGALALIDVYPAYNGFDMRVGSTGMESPPHDAVSGDWFTFQYSGSVGDWVNVYDYTLAVAEPAFTKTILPEPSTMVLMGLGSLLLFCRRE